MKQGKGWPEELKKPLHLLRKYKYLLLVICAGILLLLIPGGRRQTGGETVSVAQGELSFSLEAEERKMEQALSSVAGAGRVKVVLTLQNSGQRLFLRDETKNQSSGLNEEAAHSETQTAVVVSRGSGLQDTVLTDRYYPRYQGALVVCDGGGAASVCLELTNAVSALTGLGADKITVLPMGSN